MSIPLQYMAQRLKTPYRPMESRLREVQAGIVEKSLKKFWYNNLKFDSKEPIEYGKPRILVGNHFKQEDAFAIYSSYLRNASKDQKRLAREAPLMRNDFFKEGIVRNVANWFLQYLGTIMVDRNKDRLSAKEIQNIKEFLEAKGTILLYPAITRSKTGELFATHEGSEVMRIASLPMALRWMKDLDITPVNYMYNPVYNSHKVTFGKTIPFNLADAMKRDDTKEYFAELNKQVLKQVEDLTPVNTAHVAATYIQKLREKKDNGNFVLSIENMEEVMSNIAYRLKSRGVELDTDMDLFMRNNAINFFNWADSESIGVNEGDQLKLYEPDSSKPPSEGDKILFLANQVKHIKPLEDIIEEMV